MSSPTSPESAEPVSSTPADRGIRGICGALTEPEGIMRAATCELLHGHSGWHRDGGMSWVDRSYDPAERERAAYERGKAEATEGWGREWGTVGEGWAYVADDERAARDIARYTVEPCAAASRLVGPWEPADEPTPVVHALGCMCGTNDAGQRFNDPICRRTS